MLHSTRSLRFLAVLLSWLACIPHAPTFAAEAFGGRVARTLQEGDGPGFSTLVDQAAIVERAVEGLEGSEEFVGGVRKGLAQGLSQVGTVLVNNLGSEFEITYLRTRTVQGVRRALVRVDLGDRGLNYMDFFLRESADGDWLVFDWLDYAQGQTYTDSLRMTLALMVQDDPSLVSRLLGLTGVDRSSAKKLGQMGQLGQRGDWAGWLEVYRSLPDRVRNGRVLAVNRIAAASAVGDDDEYMRAMTDLHAHHGDDPTLGMALVDYYMLTGDFDRAYRAVDRLDAYTGGDAALTNLRAGIALYQGDNPASVGYARQAVALDEDYEDSYWNLMVAGARAADFGAAMEGVRALESRFGYEFSEEQMLESEDLAGLAESAEWKASRTGVAAGRGQPQK